MVVVSGRVLNRAVKLGKDGVSVATSEVDTGAGIYVCAVHNRGDPEGPEVGRWGFFTVTAFLGRKEGTTFVSGYWLLKSPDLVAEAATAILEASPAGK